MTKVEIEFFIAERKENVRRWRREGPKISKKDAPYHFAWAIMNGLEIYSPLPLELSIPALELISKCVEVHKKGAKPSRKS